MSDIIYPHYYHDGAYTGEEEGQRIPRSRMSQRIKKHVDNPFTRSAILPSKDNNGQRLFRAEGVVRHDGTSSFVKAAFFAGVIIWAASIFLQGFGFNEILAEGKGSWPDGLPKIITQK